MNKIVIIITLIKVKIKIVELLIKKWVFYKLLLLIRVILLLK